MNLLLLLVSVASNETTSNHDIFYKKLNLDLLEILKKCFMAPALALQGPKNGLNYILCITSQGHC